jgi:hypothetical protein
VPAAAAVVGLLNVPAAAVAPALGVRYNPEALRLS